MISPVSTTGPGAIDPIRVAKSERAAVADAGAARVAAGGASTPAARLASYGPPIDTMRVTEIRAALREGTYTIDADRLAAAMLALDMPTGS